MIERSDAWWSRSSEVLLRALGSAASGLSRDEAARRLAEHGPNALDVAPRLTLLRAILGQLQSPLVLLLVFAAVVSALVREWTDAGVVVAIVLGSAVLGAMHEHRASAAVERLRARVEVHASVLRDGLRSSVPARAIVPGDVVLLAAGSLVPGDGVLLEAKDLFVSQALLTGESFPVAKEPGVSPPDAPIAGRESALFLGSSVRSGTARMLVVRTGRASELGAIARTLSTRPPETAFEAGLRRFGMLLMRVMIALTLVVFVANVIVERPAIEALLFAIALAVGISPELLPAILTMTLARGAQRMAEQGVIVKRLAAIENFGAMDVLCTDKTGTLTEGTVRLDAALAPDGRDSDEALRMAFANAALSTGMASALDDAIVHAARERGLSEEGIEKCDEVPYDFARKRVSVVISTPDGARTLVVKGAVANVLEICSTAQHGEGQVPLDDALRESLAERVERWGEEGFRVLAVATRACEPEARYEPDDERSMVLVGFLRFVDPPKAGAAEVLRALAELGVRVVVVTGDARGVAVHVARALGLSVEHVITGAELGRTSEEALWAAVERTTIFAEVDPAQKERVIRAMRRRGHVVGYIGDGINDAPAMHAADVAISVDGAADVAKEAAEIVLGSRDLEVLRAGVESGRVTFANTLKYVRITTSANFGNMVSMAVASFWLPFLPLLATQILLNNFLSDVPATTISGDDVDPEAVERPERWDLRAIRDFMIVFGLVSSFFDLLSFFLLAQLGASEAEFRTAWFVLSLLTELGIALIVRTARPSWRSRPSRALLVSTALVALVAIALPYTPLAPLFSLVPLGAEWMALVLGITLAYMVSSELAKPLLARIGRAR